jgi:hypothetical protein
MARFYFRGKALPLTPESPQVVGVLKAEIGLSERRLHLGFGGRVKNGSAFLSKEGGIGRVFCMKYFRSFGLCCRGQSSGLTTKEAGDL